jgi:PDZ domain-containing protein
MKRLLLTLWMVAVLGLAFGAGFVRLPYYSVGPGPANEVVPLIHVQGHPTYDTGTLVMTTVQEQQLTAVTALAAWLNPDVMVVSQQTLYPPGTTISAEQRRSISQMDQSKIDATALVLGKLAGYPKAHGSGALIEGVGPGCPAEGKLFSGDVILAIDGQTIATAQDASSAIDGVAPGTPIDFRVRAGGETQDVHVARGSCPGIDRPVVGISSVDNFPFPVTIASGNIGGPSAGSMFALSLYDLLTPGDLTSGRVVAGTGTIAPDGSIGPIGGITDKIVAAREAGATIFLCPKANYAEAKTADPGSMRIVPVGTFDEALSFLKPGAAG